MWCQNRKNLSRINPESRRVDLDLPKVRHYLDAILILHTFSCRATRFSSLLPFHSYWSLNQHDETPFVPLCKGHFWPLLSLAGSTSSQAVCYPTNSSNNQYSEFIVYSAVDRWGELFVWGLCRPVQVKVCPGGKMSLVLEHYLLSFQDVT